MTSTTPAAPRRAIADVPEPPPSPRGDGLDWLRDLDWRAFERLVADAFQRQGFTVLPTAHGPDGGIDLILVRGHERIFVQCKQWRAYRVGAPVVRELFGLVTAHRATGGIVVTSGTFTPEAIEFARISGVVLMDGPATASLTAVGRLATPPAPRTAASAAPVPPPPWAAAPWPAPKPSQRIPAPPGPRRAPSRRRARASAPQVPFCPICSAPMVQRRARRGPASGQQFWGCSRFPGCKGVREASAGPIATTPRHPAAPPTPRRGRRALRRLTLRLAQLLTIVLAVALSAVVISGVLTAILHR